MPKIKLRRFNSTCVVDQEGRDDNLAWFTRRGLPLVKQIPEHGDPLAIVASGPSLRDYLDELKTYSGHIWAINGAYDYLLDHGIVPQGFFGMDPLPGLAQYLERAHKDTTFYVSSTCDPAVFDILEGHTILAWHAEGSGMTYPPGEWHIGGGTSAVTRAPYLGLLQGYRDVTCYGVDSSFENGEPYCYKHGTYDCDIDNVRLWVSANGEGPFETELGLMKQVSALNIIKQKFRGKLEFKCGGLLAAFMRAPEVDEDLFEIEEDAEEDAA